MKKKIINIMILIFLVTFFTIINKNTCQAEVDTYALQGNYNGVIAQQQVNQSNNPKYAERNNTTETVDPITGNLILKQTDISLKGKDGLDLSIGRIYNSSQDEYEKKVKITQEEVIREVEAIGYVFDVLAYNKHTGSMFTFTTTPCDYLTTLQLFSYWMNYQTEDYIYIPYNFRLAIGIVRYIDYKIIKTDYTDEYSYNKTRDYLGAGWSYNFPSVQIEKDSDSSNTYIYYHDGNGAVYHVINTTDTGQSNLEDYQKNNVKFVEDNGTYINEDKVSSKYKFVNSDLTTQYFAADGKLLGIKDRFGNEIKFKYTDVQIYDKKYPILSQITDSVGRIISFTYGDTNIDVAVSSPNESKQLKLTYGRSFYEQTLIENGQNKVYKYPVLDYVIDTMGNKTSYTNYYELNGNTWPKEKFSYTTKNLDNALERNRYLLGGIVYPASKTYFEYEKTTRNLGTDGVTECYRIKSRHDEIQKFNKQKSTWEWIKDNNCVTYTYNGDCTGYPEYIDEEHLPDDYQFYSEATTADGVKVKTIFNKDKHVIQEEKTAGNNEKEITKNLEFDSNYKELPTKKEISYYLADGTLASTYYMGTNYNSWGGVSSYTDNLTPVQYNNADYKMKHTTILSYDDPTYKNYVTKKQWYQNDSRLLSETYQYDSLGRILKTTNAKGEVKSYNYYLDSSNKVEEITTQLEDGKVAKTKNVYGTETNFAYPKEQITISTDNQGALKEQKTTYTYDLLLGLVLTETDNENNKTEYTYDNYGRVVKIQNPDYTNIYGTTYGVSQEFSYVNGYNWEYVNGDYVGAYGTTVNSNTIYVNKLNQKTYYYNQESELYNAYGNLLLEKNRSANVFLQKYTYDKMQRITSSSDNANNTIYQSYGPWGKVYEIIDASGNLYKSESDLTNDKTINYFVAKDNIASYRANPVVNTYKEDYSEEYYDQYGRTIKRSVYPSWPDKTKVYSENYTYDISGNLIGYTDPNGNRNEDGVTTSYQYDELNRLINVKNTLNNVTDVQYTVLGNITSITLKQNKLSTTSINLYTKSYDELGELTTKTDAAAKNTNYSYNSKGLTVSSIDRNQNKQLNTYDPLNQLTDTVIANKTGTEALGYKYGYSSPLGVSEGLLYNNGSLINKESYYYDKLGQLVNTKNTTTDLNSNVSLQYDSSGRLINVGVTVGSSYFATNYGYTADRLTKIQTDGKQQSTTSDVANAVYDYYPDGKLKKITYPKLNDNTILTSEYYYDALGRLISLMNKKNQTTLSTFQYTYDANGNILSQTDGSETTNYKYDTLNRLSEIKHQDGSILTYGYSLRGDRLSEEGGDFKNQFKNIQYSYDVENKLKTVATSTGTTKMEYYADGLRAKKKTSSSYTNYIYNTAGNVIAEAVNSPNVTANYVWGPDKVLVKKESTGGEYYYLYNGHGDVVQMVDRNGKVVNNYKYDEWGNILTSNETVSNPFKYAGEVYDQETGLYYLRARYYDPNLGRFINEDTYEGQVGNPLSLNLYTYCSNNPLMYVDPTGHMNYFTQTDDLLKGIKNGLIDSLNILNSLDAIYEFAKAIALGQVSLVDLASIGLEGLVGDYTYVMNHADILNPFKDVSNKKVTEYGEHLGSVISDFVLALCGAEAGKLIDILSETKAGAKIEKVCEEGFCFTEDTLISTKDGHKRIKDIKIGDEVYSENPETGEKGLKKVKNVFINETNTLIHVHAGKEEIEATPTHPFWVEGKGWVPSSALQVGDKLHLYNGSILEVTKLEEEHFLEKIKVYNFEVEDWHTYFVTGSNVLVHNKCPKFSEVKGKDPDYIKDNRVPLDKETVLSSKDYTKTNIRVKGAQVYKNGDYYYYRDTFHTGEASHLEVFDKRGNHIGEANPQTGELIPGTADPTKKINVK